ncbi:hypothetical protein LAU_0169 [Lausannevirus]|uniref:Uncharacterized protein n=1 Tax=Lausannevirus TaxID=999883 RepID=F2WL97_9VIRU|nr:hypothetical protein LAU_0169 [Lausannevirus]AEA07020.1 hypothetical protein LAU_0169 [Lausannevirus]
MADVQSSIASSVLFQDYKIVSYGGNYLQKEWEGKFVVLPTLQRKFRLLEASAISRLEYELPCGKAVDVYVTNSPVWQVL